jgi:hypothetical protein
LKSKRKRLVVSIEVTNTHYIVDNEPFVRVTEVLSVHNRPMLNKWMANVGAVYAEEWSTQCQDIGTEVHRLISEIIKGRSFNDTPAHIMEWTLLSPEIKYGVIAWMQAQMSIPFKPVESEVFVISRKYGFAGTTDCIARIKKRLWSLDWKVASKLWPEVKFQLSAYYQAYKEMTGKSLAGAMAIRLDRDTGKWQYSDQLVMTPEELTEAFTEGFLPLLKVYKYNKEKVC